MSSARNRFVRRPVALLALLLTAGADIQPFRGVVRSADGDSVPNEEVHIDGHGTYVTSDSGEFTFPPSQELEAGSEAIFHVKHWVVVRPCDYKNGRIYPLPPQSVAIQIKVLQRGDPRLLDVAAVGSIIDCLIEEEASQFKPKSPPARLPHASLQGESEPFFADHMEPTPVWESLKSGTDRDEVRVVTVGYRVGVTQNPPAPSGQNSQEALPPEKYGFLAVKAEELGFSVQELASAIGAWMKSVEDPYDKGLAALYEDRYAEASTFFKASIESAVGAVLSRYVPLARAEYEQGHYAAAESALRKVLTAHPDDPLVLNNLGVVLEAEANYGEAEPLYKRALAIDERALGPECPDVATGLSNLASIYKLQGKYADAEPLYSRALTIDEKVLGPEHPDLAAHLDNLAALYFAQGKYTEAEPLYKRALAIDEKVFGPEHPTPPVHLNNLAALYFAQGKYAEAESLYELALAIDEKVRGPEHPDVATTISNLAALYAAQGKYAEAEPLYRRALAIHERVLGLEQPDVAIDLNGLALLYKQQGKYAEAEPLYKRALAIDEKVLGPEHPTLAVHLNNLAALYATQGKYAEAEPLYKRALAIDEKVLGPEHPTFAVHLNTLAAIYYFQGKYADAELLLRRALAIDEKILGPEHPDVAARAEDLAATLRKLGRDVEAKAYEEQAARIRANASKKHKKK